MKTIYIILAVFLQAGSVLMAQPLSTTELYKAPKAPIAPTVDGIVNEPIWNTAQWVDINNLYLGSSYTSADFTGRYKILWTQYALFLLVEITDDVLRDDHADPLTNYWDDDCVEIFLDEDKSGGPHQTNYNAFAYHVSLSYDPVDIGTDGNPHVYANDIFTRKITNNHKTTWEFMVKVFPDTYVYGANNTAVTLYEGKQLGFNLAYCDNDTGVRNSFIGSRFQQDADKDRGYINADVFATLELVGATVTSNMSAEEQSFKVYPNPSSGTFSIEAEIPMDQLSVKNSEGLQVLQQSLSSSKTATVEASQLPKGIYFIEVEAGEKMWSKKIVLE